MSGCNFLEASFAGDFGALAPAAPRLFGAGVVGLVLVAGIAAHTAGRQLLFHLKDTTRATTYGPKLLLGAGSAGAQAAVVLLLG